MKTPNSHPPYQHQHIVAWVCDNCNKVHISQLNEDHKVLAQINIEHDDLNSLIIELMKLRDTV